MGELFKRNYSVVTQSTKKFERKSKENREKKKVGIR
jgi:hypothetical protein